ncbi:MAG: mobile mystery protein A [Candidatus Gastranaerophilaceae bacterium]
MKKQNKLARKKLDEKLKQMSEFAKAERPAFGWIKAIRQALGMTTTQLAKRVGVKQPRILTIESDEVKYKLELGTLCKVAEALDCDLVYALIPKTSLQKMTYEQARKKAIKILGKINYNMALENQDVKLGNEEIDELTQELLDGSQARLWDEDE